MRNFQDPDMFNSINGLLLQQCEKLFYIDPTLSRTELKYDRAPLEGLFVK